MTAFFAEWLGPAAISLARALTNQFLKLVSITQVCCYYPLANRLHVQLFQTIFHLHWNYSHIAISSVHSIRQFRMFSAFSAIFFCKMTSPKPSTGTIRNIVVNLVCRLHVSRTSCPCLQIHHPPRMSIAAGYIIPTFPHTNVISIFFCFEEDNFLVFVYK